jgi:hypothetical protein
MSNGRAERTTNTSNFCVPTSGHMNTNSEMFTCDCRWSNLNRSQKNNLAYFQLLLIRLNNYNITCLHIYMILAGSSHCYQTCQVLKLNPREFNLIRSILGQVSGTNNQTDLSDYERMSLEKVVPSPLKKDLLTENSRGITAMLSSAQDDGDRNSKEESPDNRPMQKTSSSSAGKRALFSTKNQARMLATWIIWEFSVSSR